MPPPSDHRCSNCAAWRPPAADALAAGVKGECHRHAPKPVLTVEDWGDGLPLWPEMAGNDWCYEWVSPPVVQTVEVRQPAAKGDG